MKPIMNVLKMIRRCRKPCIVKHANGWVVRYDPWFIDRFLACQALLACWHKNNSGEWPR